MPRYSYKALARSGETISGDVDAADHREAISRIQDLGHLPISARATPARGWLRTEFRLARSRKIGGRDVALLTRELSALIAAGLTVDRSLQVLLQGTANPDLQAVLTDMIRRVRGGTALSAALAAHPSVFPNFCVTMLQAAEAGGFLASALQRLADFMAKSQAVQESVRSALVYPAVLLLMACASIVLIVTVVLPQFSPMFEEAGVEPPLLVALLLGASAGVQEHPLVFALGAAALVLAARLAGRTPAFRAWMHRTGLTVPALRTSIVHLDISRFARNLGTLLDSGVPLPTALPLAGAVVSNQVLAGALIGATRQLREGRGLAHCLGTVALFPAMALEMIRVGEETGRLSSMLLHAADLLEADFQRTLERTLSLLTPALTVVLGLVIAALIGSIISVLMSINELAV